MKLPNRHRTPSPLRLSAVGREKGPRSTPRGMDAFPYYVRRWSLPRVESPSKTETGADADADPDADADA